MNTIQIATPDASSLGAIHIALLDAFSDYAIAMRPSFGDFETMMRHRSLDLAASRVAIAGDEIAAFSLVGLRRDAAYLIVNGTRPAFRRRGLSRRLTQRVFAAAGNLGASSISLEVISTNASAIALYEALGFQNQRTLNCYSLSRTHAASRPASELRETPWRQISKSSKHFWNRPPSWQNDTSSLDAMGEALSCVGAYDQCGELIGYAALVAASNTLAHAGVAKHRRRQGIGAALLAAVQANSDEPLRIINVDARDGDTHAFIMACGGTPFLAQLEMHRSLHPGP